SRSRSVMIVGSETATIEPSMTISARPAARTPSAFQRRGSGAGSAAGAADGWADGPAVVCAECGSAAGVVAPPREGREVVMEQLYDAVSPPCIHRTMDVADGPRLGLRWRGAPFRKGHPCLQHPPRSPPCRSATAAR